MPFSPSLCVLSKKSGAGEGSYPIIRGRVHMLCVLSTSKRRGWRGVQKKKKRKMGAARSDHDGGGENAAKKSRKIVVRVPAAPRQKREKRAPFSPTADADARAPRPYALNRRASAAPRSPANTCCRPPRLLRRFLPRRHLRLSCRQGPQTARRSSSSSSCSSCRPRLS